jgi:hypothetical protein
MRIERAIAAGIEPVVDVVVALEKRVNAIEEAAPGIATERHVPGKIYRKGATVEAFLGRHYKATIDTIASPGDSPDWARIGNAGFRHRGAFNEATAYEAGDLVIKDYSVFLVDADGNRSLFAARGEKGTQGNPGKDGLSGSGILAVATKGFKATITLGDGNDNFRNAEIDFTQAFEEFAREEIIRQLGNLVGAYAPPSLTESGKSYPTKRKTSRFV